MDIKRPDNIPPYAEACLRALSEAGLGHKISLGGAFALLHYHDYRTTHDIDAWWQPEATATDKEAVINTIITALETFGTVRVRSWQDVTSIELDVDQRETFSVQIAWRSAQLQPTVTSPWPDIPLDSFADLVASKMTALVDRGAPRDFVDIYTICQARLITPQKCWQLWQQRQRLRGFEDDLTQAKFAIRVRLTQIEQRRPLENIQEPQERAGAEQLRNWYKNEFLDDTSNA